MVGKWKFILSLSLQELLNFCYSKIDIIWPLPSKDENNGSGAGKWPMTFIKEK